MNGAIVDSITASEPLDVGGVRRGVEAVKILAFDPAVTGGLEGLERRTLRGAYPLITLTEREPLTPGSFHSSPSTEALHETGRALSPLSRKVARALVSSSESGPRPLCTLEIPEALKGWAAAELSRPLTASAVLIALLEREDGPHILLTRRAEHLRSHAAQVSFPGGRCDADDGTCSATALREAQEEVGLDPQRVKIIGFLDDYPTLTGFRITPVVGHVAHPPAVWLPAPDEVADVFELPLHMALDPQTYTRKILSRGGIELPFYEFDYRGHRVWGATAGLLYMLAQEVQAHGG
jgi:8-oxo-dGTP pyrophosphatase MutT (NUDIX family)